MYPRAKEAILKNRSTVLKLADKEKIKYLIVSSALYEKKLLPKTKYAEIRDSKSKEIDRLEALLEWLDDCSNSSFNDIFEGLCEGLKRSDEPTLAKKLKREAKENGDQKPGSSGSGGDAGVGKVATPKVKKPKAPKVKLPKVSAAMMDDILFPNGAKPKGKSQVKTPKTKGPRASSSKANGEIQGIRRNSAKPTVGDISELANIKILSPAHPPVRKRKSTNVPSSENALGSHFDPRNSVFGYPLKSNMGKAMTFTEAKDAFTKKTKSFNFVSYPVKPTRYQFNNKDDLFYDGCAFPVTVGLCTKKVTQKQSSYVCSSKHESPIFRKVPRLQVIFDDGTDELDITLWKSSVEILAGKFSDELEVMSDSDIRQLFEATRGKEVALHIDASKTHQRDLKKTNGREWTMNGTVLVGDNIPPPSKKQRG